MKNLFLRFILIQVAGTLICFHCAWADTAKIDTIFNDLNDAPSWVGLDIDKQGPKLMSVIEETKSLNLEQFKEIVSRLLSSGNNGTMQKSQAFWNWSKIYILNRYFFKVPAHGVRSIWSGGFQVDYDKEGPLYPLQENKDGTFTIVDGYRGGYMGPDYQGLAEADYFNSKYGLRYPVK